MEKNYINNTNEATIEQVKKFDYDFTKDIKAALERGKKFDYDFTKDIKAALERGKNKKNLIK